MFPGGSFRRAGGLPEHVTMSTHALDDAIRRIYTAGGLLNGLLDGSPLADRVAQAIDELDEALRTIQMMAFRSQSGRPDLDGLLAQVTRATVDISQLAEGRHDGPGALLDEAARYLHRARMALMEAQADS
jgi:hypothetical protein